MQATPLWVTITGFVLGPAVVAAFLTCIFNKSLNKQKSDLDAAVQEKLNEQKSSLDKAVQSSLNEQKASLDAAVQERLNEQKSSLDEAVQSRLDEQKAWRASHQNELDQWIADRRSYYLPLREAACGLEARAGAPGEDLPT